MPKYTVRDDAGNALTLDGDSPPTEQELEDIFAQVHGPSSAEFRAAPEQGQETQWSITPPLEALPSPFAAPVTDEPDPSAWQEVKAAIPDLIGEAGSIAKSIPEEAAAYMSLFQRPESQELGMWPSISSTRKALAENAPFVKENLGNISAALRGDEHPIERSLRESATESLPAATLARTSQGLASTAPLLAVGGLPGWARMLASVGFSADMIRHAPELFQSYAEEINKPEEEQDPNKIATLQSDIGQTFAFAPLAGAHGAGRPIDAAFTKARELFKGGESYASQERKTKTLYESLPSQAGEAEQPGREGQVPVNEGGARVQPQAETGVLTPQPEARMNLAEANGPLNPTEATEFKSLQDKLYRGEDMTTEEVSRHQDLSDRQDFHMPDRTVDQVAETPADHQQFMDMASKHGYEGDVVFLDDAKLGEGDPLKSQWAVWNRKTGRIEVNKTLWDAMSPARKSALVESVASEEAFHSRIGDEMALNHSRQSTAAQRLLSRKMYLRGTEGFTPTDTQLAHELIRQDMQRAENIKLTELAARNGDWTMQSMDSLYRTIQWLREHTGRDGTLASLKQRERLDRMLSNIDRGRAIVQSQSQASPQRDEDAARSIADDLGMEFKGESKSASRHLWRYELKNADGSPGTSISVDAGSTPAQVRAKYLAKVAEYEGSLDAPRPPKSNIAIEVMDMTPDEFKKWKVENKWGEDKVEEAARALTPELHDQVKAEAERLAEETKRVAAEEESTPLDQGKIDRLTRSLEVSAKAQSLREISENYLKAKSDQQQALASPRRYEQGDRERIKASYDFDYYASLLKNPDLLDHAIPLETTAGSVLAVPIDGKSRKSGSIGCAELFSQTEALLIRDLLRGVSGFPNSRIVKIESKRYSDDNNYTVVWGEPTTIESQKHVKFTDAYHKSLGEDFGYRHDATEVIPDSVQRKWSGISGGPHQQLPLLSPSRRLTAKEERRIEELRKYREQMGKQPTVPQGPAPGSEPRKVKAKSRVGTEAFRTPVTPASVEKIASDVLQDRTKLPTFKRYMDFLGAIHGDVQPGQVKDSFQQQVGKFLENAPAEVLTDLVNRFGLMRQVYGSIKGGSGITIARGGQIAEAMGDAGGIEMVKSRIHEKIARLEKEAEKIDKPVSQHIGAKAAQEISSFRRQKVEKIRQQINALTQGLQTGEGISLKPGSLFGGEEFVKPADWHDPVRGGMRKSRDRAVSALFRAITADEPGLREGLNRKQITVDDIRWSESGNDILKVAHEDLEDLTTLGYELTQGAGSNATTQRILGGGALKEQRKALPRSATKRVAVFLDRKTGKVYLVDGYRHPQQGAIFLDPLSVTGEHRPLAEMVRNGRLRPLYSIPLDTPVQNFRQEFASFKEFSDTFYRSVQEHAKRVGWRGFGTEPEIEGTEGIAGQGGAYQGPAADIARDVLGLTQGAREHGAELTEGEARATHRVFSAVENWQDIRQFMADLKQKMRNLTSNRERGVHAEMADLTRRYEDLRTERADEVGANYDRITERMKKLQERIDKAALRRKAEPTVHEWNLVTAITKMAEAIKEETKGEDLTDGEIVDLTLSEIYGLAQRTKNNPTAFTAQAEERFTEGRGPAYQPGTKATGPSQYSKELTMPIQRVPPTLVRAEQIPPGSAEVRTGAEPGRPAGITPPERTPVTKESWKLASGQARQSARLRRLQPKYSTGEPIAETPGPRESYEVPEYRKQIIQQQIAEQSERMAGKPEAKPAVKAETPQAAGGEQLPLLSLRRERPRSLAEFARNTLQDIGSGYDRWMVERIAEHGGPNARMLASKANQIIDRAGEIYGPLTTLLDEARFKSGAVKKLPIIGQVPNPKLVAGTKWLNDFKKVTPFAATAHSFDALEGKIKVPDSAKPIVDAAIPANIEIGRTVQPVVPGFIAGGKAQRNFTLNGYDIFQQGPGDLTKQRGSADMWRKWVAGTWAANKASLGKLWVWVTDPISKQRFIRKFRPSDVEKDFREFAAAMADPGMSGPALEKINQDFARRYPEVITHLRQGTRWVEVVHSNLFNYLERTARRACAIRAIRETFPIDPSTGRSGFAELVTKAKEELPAQIRPDVDNLIKALNGHPTDNYSSMTLFNPTRPMGHALKLFNDTIGHVAKQMVLSGQLWQQIPETLLGGSSTYGGYKNMVRGMARVNELYPQMEMQGSVNRLMYDWSWQNHSWDAIARSLSRYTGNAIAKTFLSRSLNELQEAQNAAVARVISERAQSGSLTPWEQRMMPRTLKAMGFNKAEIASGMAGDPQVLAMFERRAAPFMSGGNRQMAQGAKYSNNRLINSIFAFQMYPMMKANQLRHAVVDWIDAERVGSRSEKWSAREHLGRYLFNTTAQGVTQVVLASLVFGGPSGVNVKLHQAKDDPAKFLLESLLAAQSGPLYWLWRGLKGGGAAGRTDQFARMAFPYAMASDFNDMVNSNGVYRDRDLHQRIGKFISGKTPGLAAVKTAVAMVGLGNKSQPLDVAIQGLNRWKMDNDLLDQGGISDPEKEQFRNYVLKALDALKDGDAERFNEAWLNAVGESDIKSLRSSILRRQVLKGRTHADLTEEQKESLQNRIGFDAYERLEGYDQMLEAAARGQFRDWD